MNSWWKILSVALIFYTIFAGLLGDVPALAILNESIRNLYFHVTMWFAMMIIFLVSVIYSIRYLGTFNLEHDRASEACARSGMLFGILGLLTGMIWAKFTWGAFWVASDPQLNGAAATLLVYAALFLLRRSVEDDQKRARVASVYNIFAFVMMIVFIQVLPKFQPSLHPGKGGNPGFNIYDLDSKMRLVFYPAVIGWTLLAAWIAQIIYRMKLIRTKMEMAS